MGTASSNAALDSTSIWRMRASPTEAVLRALVTPQQVHATATLVGFHVAAPKTSSVLLEMAKCCQVLKSLWTACEWSKETGWTGRDNGIRAGNADGFVVGFWRDGKHTLNGITQLRICTPIWWGLFGQQDTRGGKYGD